VSATTIAEWVFAVALLVAIGLVWVRSVISSGDRGRLRLIAWRRAPRVRRAAVEAALDDDAFAPERIEAAVDEILPHALGDAGHLVGRPHVDILGVVNRAGEAEDHVVVRVRARVARNQLVGGLPQDFHIDERWTLVHHGMRWRLAADTGDPLAGSLLSSPLVASPQDDTARLREASLEELTEPRPPGTARPGGLIDLAAPPPQRLRDLAVADGRFDPLLIEAAITHIVEAWEESSDGRDAPLLAVATGTGAHALNFPAAGTGRRRVRDAAMKQWEVTRLDADAAPPQVDVRVRVKAAVWRDAGFIAAGDAPPARRLELLWTLELDEATHGHPRWRLTNSSDAS
jgi:hypothetical protein